MSTTASHEDVLRLDRQICFPIYAASNAMVRLYRPLLDALELTYPQYLVMLVLWEQDGRSVGELGTRLYLDSGTLTPLLKRMETAGLVTRARDPADERRVVVSLTTVGRKLRNKARDVPLKLLGTVPMPVADLVEMGQRLRELVGAMQTPAGD